MLGEDDLDTLVSLNDLAVLLYAQNEYSAARKLQQKVLEISRLTRGKQHADTLIALRNLADTLSALGDKAGYQALQKEIRTIDGRTTGTAELRSTPP